MKQATQKKVVQVKSRVVRGRIERAKQGLVSGWVWDTAHPNERAEVEISIDGEAVGTAVASLTRGDLASAGIGDGGHGFEFVVPSKWRDGQPHTISIALAASGGNTIDEKTLEFGTERHSLIGRIERVANGRISGWAWDRAMPGERVEIQAFVGTTLVGSVLADINRVDLARAKIGDGGHAFELALDLPLAGSPDASTIIVRSSEQFGSYEIGAIARDLVEPSVTPGPSEAPKSPEVPQPLAVTADESPQEAPVPANGDKESAPIKEAAPTNPVRSERAAAALDAALKKLKPLPAHNLHIHAKSKRDVDGATITAADGDLHLSIPHTNGWIRIAMVAPTFEALASFDWHLSVAAEARTNQLKIGTVGLYSYETNGSFKLVHRLAKDVTIGADSDALAFVLRHTIAKGIHTPGRSDLPFFLIFEFNQPCELIVRGIELTGVEPEEERIPYRRADLRMCARLTDLNSSLASTGKRHPLKWLLDEAEVAIRLECFETASQLIANVGAQDALPSDLMHKYLACLAEIALAEGRTDELLETLAGHMDHVLKDDMLFTAYSLCFPAEPSLLGFLERLPSGKLNRSFLSRIKAPGEALRCLYSSGANGGLQGAASGDGKQDLLLLASQMRHVSPALYKRSWNDYLAQFNLPQIASVDLTQSNVLSTVRFADGGRPSSTSGKVSVVMSVFNGEATIDYAIQSILNQYHQDVELLVCDDCSTDSTLTKMLRYRDDERVKLFRSLENQGTYNIRNALIAKASGKYLTFQDSDDLAHPARLSRQLEALTSSNARSVIGRWVRVRPNGEVAFFRDQQCLRMCVVSLLAETTTFQEMNGYHPVLCGADSDLFERLRIRYGSNAFVEVAEPLIFGLWSAHSLTQTNGLEATEDGYRSPARRSYAEIAARQRLLGSDIVPSDAIDAVNITNGIYRRFAGVIALN